jgi:fucose permease
MHRRRLAIGLCYSGMVCVAIASSLTPVYFTTFSALFHLTEEQLGRIAAITFAGFVLGILGTGPLADRWGAKLFILLGTAQICAGLALLSLAYNYALLLMAAFVMGIGAGVLDTIMSPVVSALQPERRASALNWLHSFYCTGAVAASFAGSVGLAVGLSWRVMPWVLMLVPALTMAGFVRIRIPPLLHEEATRAPVRHLMAQKVFLAALLGLFLAGAVEAGMSQWLPAYAERALGFSKGPAGMALSLFSVGMAFSRILAGMLGHHMRPMVLMIFASACCALSYAVAAFAPMPYVAMAGCLGIGLASGCLWPTLLALTADRFLHGGVTMYGLLAAAGNMGCLVIPWVMGVITGATQLRLGIAVGMVCSLGLIWIAAVVGHRPPSAVSTTAPT